MTARPLAITIARVLAEGVCSQDIHFPGADGGGSGFPDVLCWEDGVTILCEDGEDMETEA